MSLTVEVLAEATLAKIGTVTANDSARTSFTLLSGDCLLGAVRPRLWAGGRRGHRSGAGRHSERLGAIDASGTEYDLGQADGWLLPAADGTWLSITPTTIKRCRTIRA